MRLADSSGECQEDNQLLAIWLKGPVKASAIAGDDMKNASISHDDGQLIGRFNAA